MPEFDIFERNRALSNKKNSEINFEAFTKFTKKDEDEEKEENIITEEDSDENLYYLQFSDSVEFKKKLKGILSQINIFEKEIGQEELKKITMTNLEELFKEIKQNALNSNNFTFLLNFMQKIYLMSNNTKFKEFWIVLDNVLRKIEKEFQNIGKFNLRY